MKIYCFSKKQIIRYAIIMGIFAALLLLFAVKADCSGFPNAAVISPIYSGKAGHNQVSLMINVDWGEDILPEFLATLQKENIPATFFVTGRFAHKHPDLVKAMAQAGHEIGNHGYSHPHADRLSREDNQAEIIKTEEALRQAGAAQRNILLYPMEKKKSMWLRLQKKLAIK